MQDVAGSIVLISGIGAVGVVLPGEAAGGIVGICDDRDVVGIRQLQKLPGGRVDVFDGVSALVHHLDAPSTGVVSERE